VTGSQDESDASRTIGSRSLLILAPMGHARAGPSGHRRVFQAAQLSHAGGWRVVPAVAPGHFVDDVLNDRELAHVGSRTGVGGLGILAVQPHRMRVEAEGRRQAGNSGDGVVVHGAPAAVVERLQETIA